MNRAYMMGRLFDLQWCKMPLKTSADSGLPQQSAAGS